MQLRYKLLDLSTRVTFFLIFIYLIYIKDTRQSIITICLLLVLIGPKKISDVISNLLKKIEDSPELNMCGIIVRGQLTNQQKSELPEPAVLYRNPVEESNPLVDPKNFIVAAVKYFNKKRYDLAVKNAETALKIDPGNNNLRLWLSLVYGEYIGDHLSKEKAIYHCEQVLSRDKNNAYAQFALAIYTSHIKTPQESIPLYEKTEGLILKSGLENTDMYGKLNIFIGSEIAKSGIKDKARERYNKAISILKPLAESGDGSGIFWLNNAEENLKKLDEGIPGTRT